MRKLVTAAALAVSAAGLVITTPASAVPKTDVGVVGPMHANCGTSGPNIENRVQADATAGGTANQRSGSSTGCGAPGALQPTDDALYFCWTNASDGFTWTYLRNQRTGVHGWVRDSLLDLNADGASRGSVAYCGF